MKYKMKSAIYGFAIGDALGVPFEFKQRDSFKCTNMVGHGTWDQPAGTWSDDTSMVLATLDALTTSGAKADDFMDNYLAWYKNGDYTPYGECFDIGNSTKSALIKYGAGMDSQHCGGTDEYSNGNGALMRILPLAFYEYNEMVIDEVAALTHNTVRSKFACEMYIKICQSLIDNNFNQFDPYLCMIREMPRDTVKSTGYVLDSLIAALWCFLTTDDYSECVLTAVNLGNDTDTIAALAGGLAGIKYGYDSIPKEWIDQLANKDLINDIINKF